MSEAIVDEVEYGIDTNDDRLFNEAEVLAAIEAVDQAHAARTSRVEAHDRKRAPDSGRKAIPDHIPRIEIEHDLPADAKLCTKCAVPHPLKRIGEETRECYRFTPRRSASSATCVRLMCARHATRR